MEPPLQVGDLLRCPHCRKWHPVEKWHTSGTDYRLKMLYFRHNGQMFYAGQEGLESRHETRESDESALVAPIEQEPSQAEDRPGHRRKKKR